MSNMRTSPITRSAWLFLLVGFACSAAPWRAAIAQSRTVSGVVLDSMRRDPLNGAVVELRDAATQRLARTDESGEFRLNAIPAGAYRLTVRRIGYAEWTRELRVGVADTSITVVLTALAQSLDTLRVKSGVTALYGVIGSFPNMLPVAGAKVQVIGASQSAVTDSAGKFFIPLKKAGTYLVRIAHDGYAEQVLTFDVPFERTREISALLELSDKRRQNDSEGLWADFDKRAIWQGMNAVIVPSIELERSGGNSLTDALRGAPTFVKKGLRIGPSTCVFMNGKARPGMPLDNTPIENILVVELYGPNGDATHSLERAWPPGAPCGDALNVGMQGALRNNTSGVAKWAVIWTNQ